jgi:hypothetical protein
MSEKSHSGFARFVCPSVRVSACISAAPTGQFFVKFDNDYFYANLSTKFKFVEVGHKCRAFYMKP